MIGEPRCVAPMGAVLGEGPLWDPRLKRLLWLDIKGGKIFLYDPEAERTETIAAPGMVSALALAKTGGYVCARKDGFARLFIENGAARFSALASPESAMPDNRFNDGKADSAGGFWAGTMDDRECEISGSWWRLAPDGGVAKLDTLFKVTNGPAFDPARGRVYLTDSAAQTVFAAETDGSRIENKRVFLKFAPGDGYPDGMEVDAEGALWIAFWDGACVRRFSADGALLDTVAIDAPRPTSVEIVGDRLFVTSASVGLTDAQKNAQPCSGGLFEVRLSRSLEAAPAYFRG